jgi:hypothetical protein
MPCAPPCRAGAAHAGRDGLFYFHGSTTYVETHTYDGLTVTSTGRTLEKDLRVTDNGDGTWEVLVLLTGPRKTRTEDGRILSKEDGQVRILVTVDAATGEAIGDPVLVFGSTGQAPTGMLKAQPSRMSDTVVMV